ncbi:MAG: hypothetical protein SGILL_008810 [Bacillariaceae sp.]
MSFNRPTPSHSGEASVLLQSANDDKGSDEVEEELIYNFYEDEEESRTGDESSPDLQQPDKESQSSSSTSTDPMPDVDVADMLSLDNQLRNLQRRGPATLKTKQPRSDNGNGPTDSVVAEWEEIERCIDQERRYKQDIPEEAGNRGPLPPIIEAAREKGREEKAVLDTLSSGRGAAFDSLLDLPSLSNDGINFSESNLPPGATPSNYQKKFISDFEFTNDGDVQLSPDAYQDACQNAANPDGSLNFANKDGTAVPTASDSVFSPSVLETVTARPMAPYEEAGSQTPPANKQASQPREDLTIEHLAEQARQARMEAEQHPEAGERLHQRIMDEEEELSGGSNQGSDDPTSTLFQEALSDPEKAWEFWNKDDLETKQRETEELERMLDEKMKLFEELSKTKKQENLGESPMGMHGDTRDVFFENTKLGKDFQENLENDRIQHARNVELYYSEAGNDWYGNKNGGSKVPEIMEPGEPSSSQKIRKKSAIPQRKLKQQQENTKPQGQVNVTGEWVLVEDPTTSDEPFYWNSVTDEMRWDAPLENDTE